MKLVFAIFFSFNLVIWLFFRTSRRERFVSCRAASLTRATSGTTAPSRRPGRTRNTSIRIPTAKATEIRSTWSKSVSIFSFPFFFFFFLVIFLVRWKINICSDFKIQACLKKTPKFRI
jgi:hypothetical protein